MPSLDSMTVEEQVSYVTKGCVDVVREVELRKKLQRAITERKPLVVKVGFDPTAPDLHLGHVCLLYTSPSPRDGLLARMPSSA